MELLPSSCQDHRSQGPFGPQQGSRGAQYKLTLSGPNTGPERELGKELFSLILPSPAHEVGLVSLQVAGREGPLSASVLFEYRARRFLSLPSTQLDWLSLDGKYLAL